MTDVEPLGDKLDVGDTLTVTEDDTESEPLPVTVTLDDPEVL